MSYYGLKHLAECLCKKKTKWFCLLIFIIAIVAIVWQDEEIGKETLDKELDEKKDHGTTQGVCYRREAGSDDAYSNVYNVLQPNYGTERTVPVIGPNNKRQEPQAY